MIVRVCRESFLKSSGQDRKVLRSGVGRSISVSRAGPQASKGAQSLNHLIFGYLGNYALYSLVIEDEGNGFRHSFRAFNVPSSKRSLNLPSSFYPELGFSQIGIFSLVHIRTPGPPFMESPASEATSHCLKCRRE